MAALELRAASAMSGLIGWRLGVEGRKLHAGSALFGADGTLRGKARQTWIVVNG